MITVTERIVEDFGDGYALVEVVAECPLDPEDSRVLEVDEQDDHLRHNKKSLELFKKQWEEYQGKLLEPADIGWAVIMEEYFKILGVE